MQVNSLIQQPTVDKLHYTHQCVLMWFILNTVGFNCVYSKRLHNAEKEAFEHENKSCMIYSPPRFLLFFRTINN